MGGGKSGCSLHKSCNTSEKRQVRTKYECYSYTVYIYSLYKVTYELLISAQMQRRRRVQRFRGPGEFVISGNWASTPPLYEKNSHRIFTFCMDPTGQLGREGPTPGPPGQLRRWVQSLSVRRHELGRRFFRSIAKPSSCLHDLLPQRRDSNIISRLRRHTAYPKWIYHGPELTNRLPIFHSPGA